MTRRNRPVRAPRALRPVENPRIVPAAPGAMPAAPPLLPRVLNAVCGEFLAHRGSALATPMTLRTHDGRALAPRARDCAGLRGRSVAIFVHGLGCDESSWSRDGDASPSYADTLAGELGHVPLFVRYNTGVSVAGNGEQLARIVREVWRATRGGIAGLVLVGHSMGGLVARHACAHAARRRHGWLGAIRMLVCLGTPHRGAALPKLVGALPGPIASVVGTFSAGLRDLEHGIAAPFDAALRGIPHRYVAGHLAPRMPGSRWLGDGLVALDSAAPAPPRGADVACVELDGVGHLQLLNEPRVHAHLRRWLRRSPKRGTRRHADARRLPLRRAD